MPGMLLNIDVPDIDAGIAFYTAALGLTLGRRFDAEFVELLGGPVPIYLLQNDPGTPTSPAPSSPGASGPGGDMRRYDRHWTPIHPDFLVDDIAAATARALAAGAVQEGETRAEPYGRLAMFADPFGHGFCLIECNDAGYDALLDR